MTSALHSNGLGQTSQERRESLPQSNRKEKWEKVNNNDNTHTHTPFMSAAPSYSAPPTHTAPGALLFLNSARAASSSSSRPLWPLHFPIIVLSLQGVSPTSLRASGGQVVTVIVPTWACRCSAATVPAKKHRPCPAGGSSSQPQGSCGQRAHTPPSQRVGWKTPNSPQGLWELPNTQLFPQCSFIGTLLMQMCKDLPLIPQTHFLCQPWEIHKNVTWFLPFRCPHLMRGQTPNTDHSHTGQ